jgi:ABC-2 type transport system ATP-binding protein
MLTVSQVNKSIDGVTILDDISFELRPGTITGLVGRNGVGKTTLLRTMVGILDPDGGEVLWNGVSIHANPLVKQAIYFVPDSSAMFNSYSIKELVTLHERVYSEFDAAVFYELLERFRLPASRRVRSYSKGMKALLFMIIAIATRAELIVLDEPTNGLDVIVKKQIIQLLIEDVSDRQVALLISSHHLEELEKMTDVVIMMKETRLESVIQLDEIKHKCKKIQVAYPDPAVLSNLELKHVKVLSQVGRVTTLLIEDEVSSTLRLLQDREPLLLEELPVKMEDLFISTLGGDVHAS